MPEQTWYAVNKNAASPDEAEVLIYDEIGAWGVDAKSLVNEIGGISAGTINVRVNTPGGSVFDGTAIHNALKAHPARVVMHVEGVAASAGSFIMLAGDEVRMADNAYVMIHDSAGGVMGGAEDMRGYAELLDKIDGNIAAMYSRKTGKPPEHYRALMDAETWFTADEAKAEGLVDTVYTAKPAKAAKASNAARFATIYNKVPDGVRRMWGLQPNQTAPIAPPSGGQAPALSTKETPTMSDTLTPAAPAPVAVAPAVPTPAPVAAAPAPSTDSLEGLRQITAQQYVDRGVATGKLLERQAQQDILRDLVAACPGKPDLAINAFLTGQSAASVKLAFDAAQAAEQAGNARIAALELEHARALALSVAGGVPGGVPSAVGQSDPSEIAFAPGTPPETQAKMEWDGNYKNCRHSGATEKQYTLTRVAQLNGQVRSFVK